MRFAEWRHLARGLPVSRLLTAALLILCEGFYALKTGAELLELKGLALLLNQAGSLLAVELITRGGWAFFLGALVWRSKGMVGVKEVRILIFTTLTAFALALLSCFAIVAYLAGFRFALPVLAWLKALELFLLLIWALSLLLFLVSPFFRQGRTPNGKASPLLLSALSGACVYFLLKGLGWLELIGAGIPLPFNHIRPFWIVLPLLVFIGRLAFILLITFYPENGGKAAER